jgi:drug/metabolite transporter (DMT)-like permease
MVTAGGPPQAGGAPGHGGGHGGLPPLGPLASRRMPPIAHVAVLVIALVIAGGIYLAAYLPRTPSIVPALGLLIAAAVCFAANAVMLSRLEDFAWHVFWRVCGWAVLAYTVVAGMIELVMFHDGTRGSILGIMTGLLVIFAVDIPVLLAFSVARYQSPNIRS